MPPGGGDSVYVLGRPPDEATDATELNPDASDEGGDNLYSFAKPELKIVSRALLRRQNANTIQRTMITTTTINTM